MIVQYTNKQLETAVKESSNLREVIEKLGIIFSNEIYKSVYSKIHRLGIDAKHLFKKQVYLNLDKNELEKLVNESNSIAELLRKLEIRANGGSYKYISNLIEKFKLDTKHFSGKKHSSGRTYPKVPLEDYLSNKKSISSFKLKIKLIKNGLLKEICSSCNLTEWLGEPIPLELDHIDGNFLNNNLENLRILCPNCHAKTNTYRGRNKRTHKKCCGCDSIIFGKRKYCSDDCLNSSVRPKNKTVKSNTYVKAGQITQGICKKCTGNFEYIATGRKKQFCSKKCKVLAREKPRDWDKIDEMLKTTPRYKVAKELGISGSFLARLLKKRNKT